MLHTETVGITQPNVHLQPDYHVEFHCGTCKLYSEQINAIFTTKLHQNSYQFWYRKIM